MQVLNYFLTYFGVHDGSRSHEPSEPQSDALPTELHVPYKPHSVRDYFPFVLTTGYDPILSTISAWGFPD